MSRRKGCCASMTGYVPGAAGKWFGNTNETKKQGASPMARGQSLQDPFLNALRKERVPVSIYLVNGIKLQGQIDSFDQFVVLLKNSVSQMVYKHAFSTVLPSRNLRLATAENGTPSTTVQPPAE